MKIVYAVTISGNENDKIVRRNISNLNQLIDIEVITIVNSNNKVDYASININEVGDMKTSRLNICKEAKKIDADLHMIMDSDIDLGDDLNTLINKVINYKEYDFISLYYKGEPPIPAFYTLASSLTDYYNNTYNLNTSEVESFFDDSEFNDQTYQSCHPDVKNRIEDILFGFSYSRAIGEFTSSVDELDYTTGGATIYFNRDIMDKDYEWPNDKNDKSLTWFDSFKTMKLATSGSKFAKVPLFVEHRRFKDNIQLSWNSVWKYINGLNYFKKQYVPNWNQEAIVLHTIELYWYIKGMLKKIEDLSIRKELEEFIDIDINKEIKENVIIWK